MKFITLTFLASLAYGQTNKVVNFSAEVVDPTNSTLAANWTPEWSGYVRVAPPTNNWDGAHALRLKNSTSPINLAGAKQRVTFNQTEPIPILITARVRGENIQNISSEKYGTVLYCRVKRTSGVIDYCPTTSKTKNMGTFSWRYLGINTANLLHGDQPIEWVEVIPMLGQISGTAWFDDIHVAEYPQGLFRGAVTFMFDDGFLEHRTVAFPLLSSYGWKGVEAAVVNYLSSGDPNYINLSDLKIMANDPSTPWEISDHTLDHSDLTLLSAAAIDREYYWSKKFFVDNGFTIKNLSLPFGGYSGLVLGLNSTTGYFKSVRGSEVGYNPMGTFPYSIRIQKMEWDTSLDQVNTWIQEAIRRKAWLVIMTHKIRDVCPDQFCVNTNVFGSSLAAVHSSALPVITIEEGLNLVKSPR